MYLNHWYKKMKLRMLKGFLLKRTFKWRAKIFENRMKKKKENQMTKLDIKSNDRVLIIAPHADDEFVGCEGFLNVYKNDIQITVFLCSYTGENKSIKNKVLRENEFLNFCKNIEIDYVISSIEVKAELEDCIKKLYPTHIFLTPLVDPHCEHRKVNQLLFTVLSEINHKCKIVWYQVSFPISNSCINRFVPFSDKENENKWSLFYSVYSSQKHMHIERFRTEERLLGKSVNAHYAEGYYEMSFDIWKFAIKRWKKKYEKELDFIKKHGLESCLSLIYQMSDRIYNSLFVNKNF